MKTSRWSRLFGLAALLVALALFAACGGGDDDDDDDAGPGGDSGSSNSSDSTKTSNSSGDSGPGGSPSGSEEKYVGSICKATLNFTKALEKINPADFADEDKVFEVLEEPYEDFVNDLEDAKPPKEMKEYHEQALKQLKAGLKAIKDKDQTAIEAAFSADFPEPPANVEARMQKAAADNKDCTEAGVTFD